MSFFQEKQKMKKKKSAKFNAQKLSSYEDIDSLVENENHSHFGNTVFVQSSPKLSVVSQFPFNFIHSKFPTHKCADSRT